MPVIVTFITRAHGQRVAAAVSGTVCKFPDVGWRTTPSGVNPAVPLRPAFDSQGDGLNESPIPPVN
jgi:hypothetical protein